MAKSDIRTGVCKMFLAGTENAFTVEVEITRMHDVEEIMAASTGSDVHGHIVTGRRPQMKIRMKEPTVAALRQAMSIAGEDPLAVGAQLPAVALKLRPFGDSDDTRAFTFYAANFTEFAPGRFGASGQWTYEVTAVACRDAEGDIWGFGNVSDSGDEEDGGEEGGA